MTARGVWDELRDVLDAMSAAGRRATFWLRDDDAVEPSPALEQLLTSSGATPLALAVIPEPAARALAERLREAPQVSIVQHGWTHFNHAPPGTKKQEYGAHRPTDVMLAELRAGRVKLSALFGQQFIPMFVPPWNRIDAGLASLLPAAGYAALSTFGTGRFAIRTVNSTVDIMDWHGHRGGREHSGLVAEIMAQLRHDPGQPVGVLAHHLVHDATAWAFLKLLFEATNHPVCSWVSVSELVAQPS